MSNYQQLKDSVSDVIKTNGNKKITGAIMQNTLLTIINTIGANMQFAGVADVSTNPGTPDQNLFWIASTPGIYVNFSNIVLNPGESAIIKWENRIFTKQILGLSTDERIEQVIKKYSTYKRGCLKKDDGSIVDNPVLFTKEPYIELMQGETSITYIGEIFSMAAAICFYDNEKNHISSLPASGHGTVKEIYDAEIPTNAKYIRYTSKFGLSLNIYTNARQIEYMPFDDIKNIRATAENAQTSAENAQTSAENAQTSAENAQTTAENAQTTAENAQTSAENAQASAENAQATAENAQASAENAQATAENAQASAENAQASAEEIKNDLAVVSNSLDGSNLDGISHVERAPYFGTLFYENNTPVIYDITRIVYKASKTFSNNKLILFDYLESENKMKVVNIVDIQDAVEGENIINIEISIKKGQALYILGNDLYNRGASRILGVTNVLKRLSIPRPDTLKVGDILDIIDQSQSGNKVVKCIRLIGSYRNYLTVEDVDKKIDLAVVNKPLDGSNLNGISSYVEAPSYFGTLFYENDTPVIYEITQIIYKASKTFSNNKLILLDYLESENKMKIVNIVDIQDAVQGDNTIDIEITIKKGQALYILGNDLYNRGESKILGVTNVSRRLSIPRPDTLKVGDILGIGQSAYNVVKCIRLIGSYHKYLTVEDVNKLIDDKNQDGEFGKITNYLKGKVLSVTGGSEAAGYSIGKTNTYGNLIAERNGMTINNYAIEGRKLVTGDKTSLVDTYQEIALNSDYILVQIGYNDGFSSLIEDDSVDTTTFKGAFNVLVRGLQSRYPTAKIGIIEPYHFRGLRTAWIEERCKFYHIQYIDVTLISGFRYDCDEQAVYFIDEVHLTKLGHERMSYIYEQFMRGL